MKKASIIKKLIISIPTGFIVTCSILGIWNSMFFIGATAKLIDTPILLMGYLIASFWNLVFPAPLYEKVPNKESDFSILAVELASFTMLILFSSLFSFCIYKYLSFKEKTNNLKVTPN